MDQPDIGLKVAELRQEKGLTQEQLAEYCEVSARTIQRIENGEVAPRAFTRNSLSNALEFDFGVNNVGNETFWLALLHLSCNFANPIFPLVIWSWKKNQSYKIDKHGKDVLNFQITVTLALFSCLLLLVCAVPVLILINEELIGSAGFEAAMVILTIILPTPMILVGMFSAFQGIINTMRVLADKPYKYPLSIQFVK